MNFKQDANSFPKLSKEKWLSFDMHRPICESNSVVLQIYLFIIIIIICVIKQCLPMTELSHNAAVSLTGPSNNYYYVITMMLSVVLYAFMSVLYFILRERRFKYNLINKILKHTRSETAWQRDR